MSGPQGRGMCRTRGCPLTSRADSHIYALKLGKKPLEKEVPRTEQHPIGVIIQTAITDHKRHEQASEQAIARFTWVLHKPPLPSPDRPPWMIQAAFGALSKLPRWAELANLNAGFILRILSSCPACTRFRWTWLRRVNRGRASIIARHRRRALNP